jgi:D-alanyl-D-alanine carboxypeptidase (penicillin-binding protein 5/6)
MYLPGTPAAMVVPAPPKIKSLSYLVMDFDSGKFLVSEKIDERVEPASLTKVMTAYVVANELAQGNIQHDDLVQISEKAWRMEGSKMFVEVNTQVSIKDLLLGVIIQSGNDASVALAEHIAGSEEVFAQLMNQHAAELGMTGSHFMNSTGLPHDDHYTTARDMAILAAALVRKFPDEYKMHSMREFEYNGIHQINRNRLLWRDESVDGIKTGHTDSAGYCLVASAKRGDMRLISVVMGTDSDKARTIDSQSILNYAFRFFETHKLYSSGEVIVSGKVWKGDRESVDLGLAADLYVTVPRGSFKQLDAKTELNKLIIAPVAAQNIQGNLKVSLNDEIIDTRPLIALSPVGEGSLFNRVRDEIMMLFE